MSEKNILAHFQYGNTIMNAIEFFTKYKTRVNAGTVGMSIYQNNKAFTELINKKIIPEIIESQCDPKLTAQNEYFRIDAVGWVSNTDTYKDKIKQEVGLNAHVWDLKIAIEHENNPADWMDEVVKLIHVKCPLKVIIGYNHCNTRDCESESDEEKLKVVSKIMGMIDAFYECKKEEYLIILGNCKGKGRSSFDYENFDYRGYLYNWDLKMFERI